LILAGDCGRQFQRLAGDAHRPNAPKVGCLGLLDPKKVPPKLEIHPERRRVSKGLGQAQRRARGHAAPLVDQLVHALIGNVDTSASSRCVIPSGLRNSFRSISPGCVGSRWAGTRTIFCLLMIVHNLCVRRPRFRPVIQASRRSISLPEAVNPHSAS